MDWRGHKTASELKLLANMEREAWQDLVNSASAPTFEARATLFKEGTTATHLHIVLSGSVELFASSGTKEASMVVLGPGDAFILAAVVKNAVALMSARTIERSQIMFIPAEAFRRALQRDPGLAAAVTNELGADFRNMVRQLRNQKLRSGKQRLAAYLLQLQRQQGRRSGIDLKVKKRVLASLLGLEPETLSRAFAELRAYGVEVQPDQIVVTDMKRLEDLIGVDWCLDDPHV